MQNQSLFYPKNESKLRPLFWKGRICNLFYIFVLALQAKTTITRMDSNLHEISLRDLSKYFPGTVTDTLSDDFFIAEVRHDAILDILNYPCRLNGYLAIFCLEGELKAEINLKTYDITGRLLHSFQCPSDYDIIASNGRYVAFLNGADLKFYNASGKLRYEGTLVSAPRSMSFMGNRSLFLNTGDVLQKITLK